MSILLILLAIAFFAFVLNIVIIQSNNFIFLVFRKPVVWVVFMGALSFVYFFIGSKIGNSFNVVWLSAFIAFILQLPSRIKKGSMITGPENNKMIDDMYNELGIKNGRLKYRIGLACYLIGGVLGWFLFYGQVHSFN